MPEISDRLVDLAVLAAEAAACIASSAVLTSPKAIAAAIEPYLLQAYANGWQEGREAGLAWSLDQIKWYFDSQGETAR